MDKCKVEEKIRQMERDLCELKSELKKCDETPITMSLSGFSVCEGKRISVEHYDKNKYRLIVQPDRDDNIFMAESLTKVLREHNLKIHSVKWNNGDLTLVFIKDNC